MKARMEAVTNTQFQAHKNQRIDWIDYAKGICIIAVVSMHTTLSIEQSYQARGWMSYFVDFAQPFRMPDFFLIAGLLIMRVIDRPWLRYLDTKVLHFVYFYALWTTIKFIGMHGPDLFGPERHHLVADYLKSYVQPQGPLWFIYILPLFFIAVRLLRTMPVWIVLIAAATLKLADLHSGWKLIDRFGIYFIFFYSGHAFAPQLFRSVAWSRSHLRLTLLILAVWFAANTMLVKLGVTFLPAVHLLTGYAGAVALFFVAALLAPLPWMRWLRYLGHHSLVIYLGFVIPVELIIRFITPKLPTADIGFVSMASVTVSILSALVLFWMTRNTPLGFLFQRPAWVSFRHSGGLGIKVKTLPQ
jgi:uncharacterized membrane protein YcfT